MEVFIYTRNNMFVETIRQGNVEETKEHVISPCCSNINIRILPPNPVELRHNYVVQLQLWKTKLSRMWNILGGR